jgi:hypothetical protein
VVIIVWQLNLPLPMKLVIIASKFVSSHPVHGEVCLENEYRGMICYAKSMINIHKNILYCFASHFLKRAILDLVENGHKLQNYCVIISEYSSKTR